MTSVLISSLLAASTASVSYVQPGMRGFDPQQKFRSVGVFGAFGKGTEVQTRDNYGLLTFTMRTDAPENSLVWSNFDDGKDLELGRAIFPGPASDKKFEFVDWTTTRLKWSGQEHGKSVASEAVFSRAFPAVLYRTEARSWAWKPTGLPADRAIYRSASGKVVVARAGDPIGPLGAPWVVLWNPEGIQGGVAPMMVRFEHRPRLLKWGETLQADFAGSAGHIAVMPLMGVRRLPSLQDGQISEQADLWSRITAAFPVGTDETYRVDDKARQVTITDRYRYQTFRDDWGTEPMKIAPIPPVTAMAEAKAYPVRWGSGKAVRSSVATFLGPYAYVPGDRLEYAIPVPSARDNALAPVRIIGDPERQRQVDEMTRLVKEHELKPDDTSDGGLNLQLKEYSQAYPLLDAATQATVRPAMAKAFDASFAPENLQTVTDPVTGGRYAMCSKIWCVNEPYDREWYTGRQLDFASEYASWVDPAAIRPHWKEIQGLYAYYRIYNDWAWSGTLSSIFAYALCGDGMNFALEGMLGTARLAKRMGDTELWRDASYRAAKQALCTYGSWFLSDWVKDVDYATWTDTSYDYEAKKGRYQFRRMRPEDVETRFGLDIYSDSSGIKTLRPGSFWHASAALFWNNPSRDRLYAELLYPKIYKWEYETMPQIWPDWTDRDKIERFANQAYGSNMVVVHIDGRTNLFGQAPSELEALTEKLQPDIAFMYKLRLRQDLARSGTPQLWLPTAQAQVEEASWNAITRTLTAKLTPLATGPVTLDWTWRGADGLSSTSDPGPLPASVLVGGKSVTLRLVSGGFYRVQASLKASIPAVLEIRY
ncbi:hypothetical protein BH11ARM2_BH11ARM2_36930 [soil metagenome]